MIFIARPISYSYQLICYYLHYTEPGPQYSICGIRSTTLSQHCISFPRANKYSQILSKARSVNTFITSISWCLLFQRLYGNLGSNREGYKPFSPSHCFPTEINVCVGLIWNRNRIEIDCVVSVTEIYFLYLQFGCQSYQHPGYSEGWRFETNSNPR